MPRVATARVFLAPVQRFDTGVAEGTGAGKWGCVIAVSSLRSPY